MYNISESSKLKKKTKKRIKKILNLSLWPELLITIVGVILGLMITNSYESYQLKTSHKKALEKVWNEVNDNNETLKDFYSELTEKYHGYKVFEKYWDKETTLLVPNDSLELFKDQVKSVLRIDSTYIVSDKMTRVRGYFEISLSSPLIGGRLRNSIWNTFSKQQSLLSITDFTTLSRLEQIYSLQDEINEQTKLWKKSMFNDFANDDKGKEEFVHQWALLLLNQKMLLDLYYLNINEQNTN